MIAPNSITLDDRNAPLFIRGPPAVQQIQMSHQRSVGGAKHPTFRRSIKISIAHLTILCETRKRKLIPISLLQLERLKDEGRQSKNWKRLKLMTVGTIKRDTCTAFGSTFVWIMHLLMASTKRQGPRR